jgi:protein TonB
VQLPLPPLPAPERAMRQTAGPQRQTAEQPPAAPPSRPAVVQPNLATIPERVPPPSFIPLPADPPPAATSGDRSGRDAIGGGGDHGDPGGKGGSGYGDAPLPIGGPISRPEVIPGTKVQPRYTEAARIAHVQGVVVLRAVIDERGNVIDVHIVKDLQFGLGDEAVKAVGQWKFTSALLAGIPVKVYFELTVQFQVR